MCCTRKLLQFFVKDNICHKCLTQTTLWYYFKVVRFFNVFEYISREREYGWQTQTNLTLFWHVLHITWIYRVKIITCIFIYCSNSSQLCFSFYGGKWHRSGVSIVDSEHISYLFLSFLLLTLNKQMLADGLFPFVLQSRKINL